MSTINLALQTSTLEHILFLGFLGFAVSMLVTPIYTTIAYKRQWWKKPRTTTVSGEQATEFQKLHAAKHLRNIPTMAGLIMVFGVAVVTLTLNLSREQTWLPLAAMVGAGAVGFIDDLINIKGSGTGIAGLRSKIKLLLISGVALVGGSWFFVKNGIDSFHVPGTGSVIIGWLIIPLFVLVVVSTANAVNISDGLDGLAGGLLASAFGVYAVISLLQQRYGVAAFCMTIVGSLLAYVWFNIFPARFFMGDIGSFALGTALGVVAMITDTVFLLPIIGLVFVGETGSVIIQNISKKLRHGKKIFRISPIHHHFEAIGWPEAKVTMRFWIIGQVCAVLGLLLAILGGFV
ncbi:MAG TPA: phospho-N-acetylmuramoyl-pentapeptide-transferase [Patescibacteria group bacterium]|nr:phospho-N-acetylmuramoyl-pentapeptide-transferase [Patescibacteria group bacterium]